MLHLTLHSLQALMLGTTTMLPTRPIALHRSTHVRPDMPLALRTRNAYLGPPPLAWYPLFRISSRGVPALQPPTLQPPQRCLIPQPAKPRCVCCFLDDHNGRAALRLRPHEASVARRTNDVRT